jgi:hypothetical protein
MSAGNRRRSRRSTAAAVAMTVGLTTGAALLLSACGPNDATACCAPPRASGSPTATAGSTGGTGANGSTGSPSDDPKGSGTPSAPAVPATLNGTAHSRLTISDGSRYVVMNGTRVDFGTQVRDLAWSPDGSLAAFVDGDGDLAVAGPGGSGRRVIAKNPGDQNWSHPTWQVRPADTQNALPAVDDILFAARKDGVSRLYGVSAQGTDGIPHLLTLNREFDDNVKPLPQTGNAWPNAGGKHGSSVYANAGSGEVYIRDDYLRQQGSALTPGSEPAMGPTNDEDIVFVRSTGGHDHLFVEHSADSGPVYRDLTPNATTDYTEPAWSSDGRTIAARTPAGIVTLPADGSAAPVKVSGYLGLPAFR